MICNSGGAQGADSVFEMECAKVGIGFISWSFDGHTTKSLFRKILSIEELDEGFEHIKIANKTLKRTVNGLKPYVKKLLSRNWFQVKNSDAIFAIGTFQPGFKMVNGGTGWAVQMSIDNKKLVYFFDQSENFWFKYNYENEIFEKYEGIPKLSENFAGIGTRDINQNGIDAIKELIENGRR
jgi:hypothetical protein